MIQDHEINALRSWRAALGDAAFIEMIRASAALGQGRSEYRDYKFGGSSLRQAAFRAVKKRVFEALFEGAVGVVRERRFRSNMHPRYPSTHISTRSASVTAPAICWGTDQADTGLYRDNLYHWQAQQAPEWAKVVFEAHNHGEKRIVYGDDDALATLNEVVGAHQYLAAEAIGYGYSDDNRQRRDNRLRGCVTDHHDEYWDTYYYPEAKDALGAFASESYPVTKAGEAVIEALKALVAEGDEALIWPEGADDESLVLDAPLAWTLFWDASDKS